MSEEYQVSKIDEKAGTQTTYRYAPPTTLPSDKADLLDKIRPDLIVTKITHILMGEREEKGKWVKDPVLQGMALTEQGAWWFSNLLYSIAMQNTAISKLDDATIRHRSLEMARECQRQLLNFWQEFGVKSTAQLSYLHQIMFNITFITLKQPENEGIRNLIKGVRSETASFQADVAQKKGVIGSLFRR